MGFGLLLGQMIRRQSSKNLILAQNVPIMTQKGVGSKQRLCKQTFKTMYGG
jgi:hypothetical protein